MKLPKILLLLAIFFITSPICFAQEKNEQFYLFDTATNPNYEDLAARLDFLAVEVSKMPDSVGYIVFNGGKDVIVTAFFRKAVKRYIAFRKFDPKKIVLLNSTDSIEPKISLWISKNGGKPLIEEERENRSISSKTSVKFIADSIELVEIHGQKTFFTVGCDSGCIIYTDLFLLSELMEANPEHKSFIVIRDKNRQKAKKTMKVIFDKATNEAQISKNKIEFLYGGKKRQSDNEFPEIEIYLAIDKSRLPEEIYKKL